METLLFEYPATRTLPGRAHVGVVASGDLEILMLGAAEPGIRVRVRVRTSVNGFEPVWRFVLDRFFADFPYAGEVDINDFGATPGAVNLRLQQMADQVSA